MLTDVPFEWFVLTLRILFIFLLYFFVFQVVRVISRDLRASAEGGASAPQIHGAILVDDPGESQLRRGETFRLDPVTVIGRNPKATIQIDATFVSSEHAQLSWERGTWWATDLHSTNGTYVNRRRIEVPTRLSPGDRLEIGGVRMRLVP
ncbi:MAG: FHA domain-containing protein [Chloroflexota bacterium]